MQQLNFAMQIALSPLKLLSSLLQLLYCFISLLSDDFDNLQQLWAWLRIGYNNQCIINERG